MSKTKSVPMRMCIACRQMKPKKEMRRITRTAEGEIFYDPTGKASGRGAYICGDEACGKLLQDKKLLHKAFSQSVDAAVYEVVKENTIDKK